MKRLISLFLVLVSLTMIFAGCGMPYGSIGGITNSSEKAPVLSSHYVLHTVKDGGTTYFCWEDGVATMTDTYNAGSVLYWENDVDDGIYYIKNNKGTVAMEQYMEVTEAPTETEPDPNQGHKLEGIVTDSTNGTTYYCWDDGTATTTDTYELSGLTWTHPWGEKFFNIYYGISNNGNVLYSEKTCSWCGNHKTYYLSYLRNYYDLSQEALYLCESCHIDLKQHYVKCAKCGYYYYRDYAYYVNGTYYCEKCYQP